MIHGARVALRRAWDLRGLPWRTKTAMTAYWLSGHLSRIRWPQRTFLLDFTRDPESGDFLGEPQPGPRRWLPAPWSSHLMVWAMRYDAAHSDHWALNHMTCGNRRFAYECPVCKGMVCEPPLGPGMHGDDDDSIPAVAA